MQRDIPRPSCQIKIPGEVNYKKRDQSDDAHTFLGPLNHDGRDQGPKRFQAYSPRLLERGQVRKVFLCLTSKTASIVVASDNVVDGAWFLVVSAGSRLQGPNKMVNYDRTD